MMSLTERVLRNYVDKRKKKINVGLSLEGSKMEGGAGVEEDPTPFPLYTPAHTFPRTAISRDILQINRSSHLAHQLRFFPYPVLSTVIHNNYY